MSEKPEISIPNEAPPTELVLEDLVIGEGPEAGPSGAARRRRRRRRGGGGGRGEGGGGDQG